MPVPQGLGQAEIRLPFKWSNRVEAPVGDGETVGSHRPQGGRHGQRLALMDVEKQCRSEDGLKSPKHAQAGPRPSPLAIKSAGKQRGRSAAGLPASNYLGQRSMEGHCRPPSLPAL